MTRNESKKKLKEKLKDSARDLYLTFDDNGDRKYSPSQIADILGANFGGKLAEQNIRKPCRETIRLWIRDNGWDNILQEAKNEGIQKAVNESEDKENTVKEAVANAFAEIVKSKSTIRSLADFLIIAQLNESAKTVKKRIENKESIREKDIPFEIRDLATISDKATAVLIGKTPGVGSEKEDKLDELLKELRNI